MAIRRSKSNFKSKSKPGSYRREEKPAGSTSYFKKKDADGGDSKPPYKKRFSDQDDRSSSDRPAYRGKIEASSGDEKPFRKNYSDKSDHSSSDRPAYRGKREEGAGDEKPFRKSYSDKSDRSSPGRPAYRGKREEGAGDEKPFRKSYSDKSDRSSSDRPTYRGKREESAGDEKPFRKSYSDKTDRSSSDRPAYRGKREEGAGDEKPFRKNYSDKSDRSSSDRPTYRGKREESAGDEKSFRKSFSDSSDRSSSERPPYRGKRESGGSDEKPFRKSYSDSSDRSSSERPPYRAKRESGDGDEKKIFKKSYSDRGEKTSGSSYRGKNEFRSASPGGPRKFSERKFSKGGSENEFKERKNFTKKPGKPRRNETEQADDGLIRLNKFISNSGICSRREADELITAGLVSVNGEVVTQLGTKVKLTDDIRYNGTRMKSERLVYVLLNKPKDYITTTDDPQQRKTVMELIAGAGKERLYPVGRLDRNTTGLLIMTNDGDLADKLMHPSTNVKKTYMVELNKNLKPGDMQKIAEGIELEDGLMQVDEIAFDEAANSKKIVGVTLHSGKNRVVRRIFEHLDYMVVKLDRTYYAGLTKRDLARGRWRHLDEMEINMLKMLKGR